MKQQSFPFHSERSDFKTVSCKSLNIKAEESATIKSQSVKSNINIKNFILLHFFLKFLKKGENKSRYRYEKVSTGVILVVLRRKIYK